MLKQKTFIKQSRTVRTATKKPTTGADSSTNMLNGQAINIHGDFNNNNFDTVANVNVQLEVQIAVIIDMEYDAVDDLICNVI